jgi:pyruvate carboxylase subunit B
MKIFAEIEKDLLTFEQREQNGTSVLRDGNKIQKYSFLRLGLNRYSLIHNNKSHLLHIIQENGIYHVHLDGEYFPVRVEDERARMLRQLVQQASQQSGEHQIIAPIPGLIKLIRIKEGSKVHAGEGILVLEAMKMENEIHSDFEGTVQKILVDEGTPVDKDQPLVIIHSS